MSSLCYRVYVVTKGASICYFKRDLSSYHKCCIVEMVRKIHVRQEVLSLYPARNTCTALKRALGTDYFIR